MEAEETEEEKNEATDEDLQKKRLEKKRKLREMFDGSHDDGDAKYLDVLKEEVQKQAEVRDQPLEAKPDGFLNRLQGCYSPFPPLSSTGWSLSIWMMRQGCSMKASGQECTSELRSPRSLVSLSATLIPTIPLSSEAWAQVRAALGSYR